LAKVVPHQTEHEPNCDAVRSIHVSDADGVRRRLGAVALWVSMGSTFDPFYLQDFALESCTRTLVIAR